MQVKARVLGEPALHCGVLVRGVVIDDEVDLPAWIGPVDEPQETQELLMAMRWVTTPGDNAGTDIEGREQRRRAVTKVVVGPSLHLSKAQRQHGLGAIDGLNLALLVGAKHDGTLWRMKVEADDIGDLLRKIGVIAELEAAGAMRLQTVGTPNPADGALTDANPRGDSAAAPVCHARRRGTHRCSHDSVDDGLVVGRPTATSSLIIEASNAPFGAAPTPLHNRGKGTAQTACNLPVARAVRSHYRDAGAQRQTLRCRGRAPEHREGLSISLRQHHGASKPSHF